MLRDGERFTLAALEASLPEGAVAYYSLHCCWWTTAAGDLGVRGNGLPCCPYCGSPLLQAPARDFIRNARENPAHYGDLGLEAFFAAHHSSGQHFRGWGDPDSRPLRFLRPAPATEKAMRCVRCASEYSEAEVGAATACPDCGARGVPMRISDDLSVRVNWHELRILAIWAERWADVVDRNDPGVDAMGCVRAIARRLRVQHPDRPPLTLAGEVAALQEDYPESELRDADGRVLVPGRKPS